ncbi:hypothetical protein [Saccharopolyspora thermophila]|nr:hypothetical protein [Saccharopolyspora subtropica]
MPTGRLLGGECLPLLEPNAAHRFGAAHRELPRAAGVPGAAPRRPLSDVETLLRNVTGVDLVSA